MVSATPSQEFVPIKEIRDKVVFLKNGELRAVLLATAVNLGLKSEEEQMAALSQFQSFLNSLEFSVQIVASSRRLDIRPYLMTLENRLADIKEELLRLQTHEYIEFIRNFNEKYNIMSKFFYVVIPFNDVAITGKKASREIFSIFKSGKQQAEIDSKAFEEKRSQLEQRISIITQGLASMGVQSKQLDTEQLIEMYHSHFNPGELHAAVKNT